MAEQSIVYRFEPFLLDPPAASLREGSREVDLSPRAFQVLAYLVEHRARVVPKQKLIEAVWKDTFVTDDALVQAITAIRRALGDDADHPRFIRTKPRVGYQFIAPVTDTAADPPAPAEPALPVWVAPVSRKAARRLLVAIQFGYLVIYSVTLLRLERATESLGAILERMLGWGEAAMPLLVVLALTGVAVRLYLMADIAMDHPQTGRQFLRLFPFVFVLDEIWAASPLLLVEDYGLYVTLALVPILAYAPFSQSTLIRSAYPTTSSNSPPHG